MIAVFITEMVILFKHVIINIISIIIYNNIKNHLSSYPKAVFNVDDDNKQNRFTYKSLCRCRMKKKYRKITHKKNRV